MTAKKRNIVGEAAVELTTQQVAQALAIAQASGFSGSADPSFVGSVLVALAVNTSAVSATIDSAKDRGRGVVGVMQH
ncbi:hypothetical protein [Acidovorax cavernicola]|uniref:Uncharacterized protein n=1 Tax=Acidovorax cavernicola TaxID=1675792 RepID=A0A9X8GXB6_9BURK|nr:hypothetical protein [Acidovorax cavernicola]RIX84598.1 hypothetical protein D3H34_02965 [Acidovorax cavernicola]